MKCAYTTILTNESYIPCVIKNAQRMRYLHCKYPYQILLSESLRTNSKISLLIKEPNIKIKFFNDIHYDYKYHMVAEDQIFFNTKKIYSNMYNTLNKFEILTLTQYDLVMFLDADTILKTNIDQYFQNLYPQIKNFYLEKVEELDAGIHKEKNCFTFHHPNGQLFLCKPNLKLYNDLKQICLKHRYEDDERLMAILFFEQIPYNSIMFTKDYHHFDGRVKLYNVNFAFINYLFEQTTSFEFNLLFDRYRKEIDKITELFSDIDGINHQVGSDLNLGGI